MVIVPKERPVLGTLNSFYVALDRLIEHCQGAFGAGCLHLRAPRTRAAIFFEGTDVVQTVVEAPDGARLGPEAMAWLLAEVPRGSYAIDVFEIDPSLLHLWASLSAAELVHADLSTDRSDLRGLIRKVADEKLSGCIEVRIPDRPWGAVLLVDEGEVIGGSYALAEDSRGDPLEALVRLCVERGGTFHVGRLPSPGREPAPTPAASPRPPPAPEDGPGMDLVEQVLGALEAVVGAEKSVTAPFSTLLRAKFLAKAPTYDFLDPFAAEFTYAEGKVRFVGDADRRLVALAVGECVTELAGELRVSRAFRALLNERFGPRAFALTDFGLAA